MNTAINNNCNIFTLIGTSGLHDSISSNMMSASNDFNILKGSFQGDASCRIRSNKATMSMGLTGNRS